MEPHEHPYYKQVQAMREKEKRVFTHKSVSFIELLSWDVSVLFFKLKTWRLKKDFYKKWDNVLV